MLGQERDLRLLGISLHRLPQPIALQHAIFLVCYMPKQDVAQGATQDCVCLIPGEGMCFRNKGVVQSRKQKKGQKTKI